MKGKVIFVLSSDNRKLGGGDKRTGWYLPEAAHPYLALTEKGYDVDFVSPKGGAAPMVCCRNIMLRNDSNEKESKH